jgi:hypothetical protein
VKALLAAEAAAPERAGGGVRGLFRRRLALPLAALALLVGGVAAVPSARSAVLDWLGIGSVEIERVPETPTTTPAALDLGERIAPPAGFPVPDALGPPDEVYRDFDLVTAVYRPRDDLPEAEQTGVGALLTELPGTVEEPLIRKLAGPGTTIEPVRVDGERGYWIGGAAHGLFYLHEGGNVREAPQRLAGPTLVWMRGDRTLRLEADVTKSRALAIARSIP